MNARSALSSACVALLLCVLPSCLDDPASAHVACDDLRSAFVAKSESLGCGLSGASYTCTALGSAPTCSSSDIAACQGAIDSATDCRSLTGASNCVLNCD